MSFAASRTSPSCRCARFSRRSSTCFDVQPRREAPPAEGRPLTDSADVRVSAVIPVFRNASGAANAANRLREQRLPAGLSLEIVVVDDGSGDGTPARLRELLSPAVRVLELPENRGRSAARQHGIDACTGAAVVFLD